MPQSTIRILFSILGDILFFDYYSSVSRRDGTFECVIVYRELSEAQLAAKLDGTEMGDRCLEVRLSQSVDRFDIGFSEVTAEKDQQASSRTLLVKCEDLSCDLDRISNDFVGISKSIELERDLSAGLPPLSARFFLLEFSTLEAAAEALKTENPNYTVAEAHKHMQSFTVGNVSGKDLSTSATPTEEVLIYGVPASKLLDPTTTRSYARVDDKDHKFSRTSSSSNHRSRSRSPDRKYRDYHDRDYGRDRYRHDRDRDRSYRTRRSRSRSAERRRR